MIIWIVVANHGQAKIYSAQHKRDSLQLIETLVHEAARVHDRDLTSDRPGRIHDRFGPARHSVEQDSKAEEANKFAREIAARLETALENHEFDELVVMADPRFLGNLRSAASENVHRRTRAEVAKNLVSQSPEEVRAELEAVT